MEIVKIKISNIIPYSNNVKEHPKEQVEQIKKSIQEFGNNDPIAVDEFNVIIEGHGRYMALKELGYEEAECIVLDNLTEDQKNAYRIVHNQLTMNSGFNLEMLKEELEKITTVNMDYYDVNFDDIMEEIDEALGVDEENPYTKKTNIPQYEPTGENVDIEDLVDESKAQSLIEEIKRSDLDKKEKDFLIKATTRHYGFDYHKIAEYYASKASPEMQRLMEKSALVIIDIKDAIKNGYTRLSEKVLEMIEEDKQE